MKDCIKMLCSKPLLTLSSGAWSCMSRLVGRVRGAGRAVGGSGARDRCWYRPLLHHR